MPTIRDVARRSGYSITTISRVLNHTGYVSSKATKKIKTVMQEMDYVPNAIARDLSNGRTHKIGVILPQIKNPYFSKILEGIMEAAFSTDYSIMLLPSNYDEKKELYYLEQLRRKEYEGLIITSHGLPLKKLAAYNKYGPIVCCEDPEQLSLAAVFTDRLAVFVQMFQWLHAQKIQSITCMFYRNAQASATTRLTLAAYQKVYQQELAQDFILTNIRDASSAYQAVKKVNPQTQYIFTNNDSNAIAVRQYYLDHQKALPGIIGQGHEISSFLANLPTIDYHLSELGRQAFQLVCAQPYEAQKVKLTADFITKYDSLDAISTALSPKY